MKYLKKFHYLLNLFKIFLYSNFTVHIITWIIALIIFKIFTDSKIELTEGQIATMLSAMGLLTTFFFLAVQKVDPIKIEKKYTLPVKVYRNIYFKASYLTEGKLFKNTIFSLVITNIIIVFAIFIRYLFQHNLELLLILGITYIFNGFIYLIIPWNVALDE